MITTAQVAYASRPIRDGGSVRWASWKLWQARDSCFKLVAQSLRAASSRAVRPAGSNRPRRIGMSASTTSSSTSVNPARHRREWDMVTPRREEIEERNGNRRGGDCEPKPARRPGDRMRKKRDRPHSSQKYPRIRILVKGKNERCPSRKSRNAREALSDVAAHAASCSTTSIGQPTYLAARG